ncbi:hypothetical protein M405DRAFT_619724 [Rhizopogon salebrosus TDB-379]|nr:hypothetical protein M405DRAFT_619724 [Rhizopogon salebrosus TDB-379]
MRSQPFNLNYSWCVPATQCLQTVGQSRDAHLPYILDNSAHTWRNRSHAGAGTRYLTPSCTEPCRQHTRTFSRMAGGWRTGRAWWKRHRGRSFGYWSNWEGWGCRINIKLHTGNWCMPSTYIAGAIPVVYRYSILMFMEIPYSSTFVSLGSPSRMALWLTMIIARLFGGTSERRESMSNGTDRLEDTMEDSSFTTPLYCRNWAPCISWSNLPTG